MNLTSLFTFPGGRRRSQPYRHYYSRDEYYRGLVKVNSLSKLDHLLTQHQDAVLREDLEVCFRQIPFGVDYRKLTGILGRPRYEFTNSLVDNHKVCFYRLKVAQTTAIAQLHLLNNAFFFARYTFQKPVSGDHDVILRVLHRKYFAHLPFPLTTAIIKDTHQNVISLNEVMHLQVDYISGDPAYLRLVNSLQQQQDTALEQQEKNKLKRLLDAL